jgi:glycolate oxidase
MLVPFADAAQACKTVAALFVAGAQPSALEFMERSAIELAMLHEGQSLDQLQEGVEAHLLIEVDAFRPEDLMPQLERIYPVIKEHGGGEPLFAEDEVSKNKLWRLRRIVGEAVKSKCPYKEEDTVVPRGKLPELLKAVKLIGEEFGFQSVCYGHAGDGNLHVNILKEGLTDDVWDEQLPRAIRKLFQKVIELGGTISGEHGIGWVQKPYMDLAFSKQALGLQQQIKAVFDPKGLLNPSKIWPDDSKI